MKKWIRLDNAAKLFPPNIKASNTQCFRIAAELTEPVRPDILQAALLETIVQIPVYQYVMKRGIFWYYLEATHLLPEVREEYKPPCSPLYSTTKKTLLYEVTYWGNRVNLEVFHVLSDGTGAIQFLSVLLNKYLSKTGNFPEPELDYDASVYQMNDDSYAKHYSNAREWSLPDKWKPDAAKLRYGKYAENRLKLITGSMKTSAVIKAAHEHNATVSVFITAVLMNAIAKTLSVREKSRPVVIAVPVNLRSVFQSVTVRNFFGVVYAGYDYSAGNGENLSGVIEKIAADIKIGTQPERLAGTLNNFSAMEHNPFARIAPLVLKNFVMSNVYRTSRKKVTATVSNLGIVRLPEPTGSGVSGFEIYAGTDNLETCVCTYRDRLTVSFTSPLMSADVQQIFFRKMTELGIDVTVAENVF
ncbi:hypothetical protein FACS189499_09990 [Clostridia bacterium]|nr:hypothetical protein FACS189499_09990 [Clostridia bacterium]